MASPRPRARSSDDALVDALVQSAFTVMAALSSIAADADLSLTQLRVLAILRDRTVGTTALADYLGLEKSTMSGLVDRAEKRGLLVRTPDPADGRAIAITLSPAGHKLAERIEAQIVRALRPRIDGLGAADRKKLAALLERMLAPES